MRRKNLKNSFFTLAIVFAYAFFMLKDSEAAFFGFVFTCIQLLLFLFCAMMIVGSLLLLFKNKNTFIYSFAGVCQLMLAVTDFLLLMLNKNMTYAGMLTYLGVNLLTGTYILAVIYHEPSAD